MLARNTIIGLLAALLSMVGFVLAVWPNLKLIPNLGIPARIGRALLTGLGFLLFSISGAIALDYLGSPELEKDLERETLGGLFCFSVPIALLTTIGSLIWYSGRIHTQSYFSSRLDKIIQNSKKEK